MIAPAMARNASGRSKRTLRSLTLPLRNLTHFDARGSARMVDVGAKQATHRVAVASGRIRMRPATFRLAAAGRAKKGDVLGVARLAAIQAAKRTAELIPLAHPIALTKVDIQFLLQKKASSISIRAHVECHGPTGVEMEALTAAAVGLLAIYDMLKAVDRGMVVETIRLEEKRGGASGTFRRGAR